MKILAKALVKDKGLPQKKIKSKGFSSKVNTLLVVEVGQRLTKVCQVKKKGKSLHVLQNFLMETPDLAIQEGKVVEPATLGKALQEQLSVHGLEQVKQVIFTLNTPKIAVREVSIPPVKDNDVKNTILTNATDYFPVDLSEYHLDCMLLERIAQPAPACRVLVVAAPVALFASYVTTAQEAGLQVLNLDYTGTAQYQIFHTVHDDKVTMFVDVDANSTTVTFVQNGVLRLQRMLGFGGDELLSELQALCPTESYLDLLQQASEQSFLDQHLSPEEQRALLNRPVVGIVRSADFFKTAGDKLPVERVVLSGSCCHVAGLREQIAQRLETEVTFLQIPNSINVSAEQQEDMLHFVSCLGSMLAPLQLLPDSFSTRVKAKKSKPDAKRITFLLCIASLALGVLLTASAGVSYWFADQELSALTARKAELAHVQESYDTYISYEAMRQQLHLISDYEVQENAQLLQLFQELEAKMPSSILLLSAVCDAEGVQMNITVPDLEHAASVLGAMRTFESFEVLQVSTITETVDEIGATVASFSLVCSYPQETQPTEAETTAGEETSDESQPE